MIFGVFMEIFECSFFFVLVCFDVSVYCIVVDVVIYCELIRIASFLGFIRLIEVWFECVLFLEFMFEFGLCVLLC